MKHKRLLLAVNELESATSPLAYLVIIFVVTPPGAIAIKINPTFNSTGIGITRANIKAIVGKKKTWDNKPTKKSFGWMNTLLKSDKVKPIPSENIMNAKIKGPIILTISICKK